MASETATRVFTFSAKEDFCYVLDITYLHSYPGYQIGIIIQTPSGDTLSNSYSFKAENSGVYSVTVYTSFIDDAYNGDITYSLAVSEYAPMPTSLNGHWLLTERKVSLLHDSMTYRYSADSAGELMTIQNDSLWRNNNWPPNPTGKIAAGTRLWELDVVQIGDTLTFSNSIPPYFSEHSVCERFYGSVWDIIWERDGPIIVPEAMLDTWYLSYDYIFEREYGHEESDEWSIDTSYNSGAVSSEILLITSDSVEVFEDDEDDIPGRSFHNSYHISFYWYFIKYSESRDEKIVFDMMEGESTKEDWFGIRRRYEYLPYSGKLPPDEW